jgi:putative ABC transport system substrate-binding protein
MQFGQLKRREFITLLGGAAVASPLRAQAQSEKVRRVGVLMAFAESDLDYQRHVATFREELRKLGWSEATLRIDERWPAEDMDRVRADAAELINLKPDAILVGGRRALSVLQRSTDSIPVVFAGIFDPVEQGIVPSLARPGGNITGFSTFESSMVGKMLELLKQIAPNITRAAFVFSPDNRGAVILSRPFEALAPPLALQPILLPVRGPAEIARAIDGFAQEPNGGLFFASDVTVYIHRHLITTRVAQHRLPAIYGNAVMVKAGGLMCYGLDRPEIFRRAASYVDRILRGEKPGDLPVQQPTTFELIIDLRTARALGIEVPPTLLALAGEVIE